MKRLLLIASLLVSSIALAQSDGEVRNIDGQKFTYKNGTWVHSALADTDQATAAYRATYKDDKWLKWYNAGGPTLKKILSLGEDVVFKFQGSDGQFHAYQVSKSGKKAAASVLGMSRRTATIVGASVIAGVIYLSNDDDDEGS